MNRLIEFIRNPFRSGSAPAVESNRRVLIVDDNLDTADSLKMLLEMSGYQCEAVCSGEQALLRAPLFRPQIVLCDLGLPNGIDGYEVARMLRSDGRLKGAALVALTGYSGSDVREQAFSAGYDLHLTKPVDPEELERLLENLCNAALS